MPDPNAQPPVTPPVNDPPPDPKPAEKKLLDDLKKQQAKNKDLETKVTELSTKLAEALPYVEKFKGHEDAKALEAQREAEARAKRESESRTRQELEAKRERAILKALLGVVPPGDDELAEFAVWKLANDKSIVYDSETDSFTGLVEARDALKASARFAGTKVAESPKKPAPGLPETKAAGQTGPVGDAKFANLKTFSELVGLGPDAVQECFEKYPELYSRLKTNQTQGLSAPTRVLFGAAPTLRSA